MSTILAGDVGGTKTARALFEADGHDVRLLREARLSSHDCSSLESARARFLAAAPSARIASRRAS